jgi:hypothetical protein
VKQPARGTAADGAIATPDANAASDQDAALLAAFGRLPGNRQRKLLDRVASAAQGVDCRLNQLVRGILAQAPTQSPLPDGPLPIHSPEEFAPALPIKRVPVTPGEPSWKVADEILEHRVEPSLASRYRYDFGQNRIFVRQVPAAAQLENFLQGYPADADLAQAIALSRWDDDASYDAAAEFFRHAYALVDGKLFPDITMFEAWDARKKVDVPDVDAIAFARQILHDQSFVSPIPKDQRRESLYQRVSDEFARYRAYWCVREAAAAFLLAEHPRVAHGCEGLGSRCQLVFAASGEDIDRVGTFLARAKERDPFIRAADALEKESPARATELREQRKAWLEESHELIREAALRALHDGGL